MLYLSDLLFSLFCVIMLICYLLRYYVVVTVYELCQVSGRLADLEATLDAGIQHRNKALESVGSQLWRWTIMVMK